MLPDRVSNPGPLTYESGALLMIVVQYIIVLPCGTSPPLQRRGRVTLDRMVPGSIPGGRIEFF